MQTVMQPLESTLEFSEDASTSGSDSFLSKLGSTLIIVLTIIALIILTWFLWHR
jgi:hypothetical protein